MREDFEAWCEKRRIDTSKSVEQGCQWYHNPITQLLWEAWWQAHELASCG
jgi:hypothetical protein